jgi:membrane protein YdbS with pleckstrin-like domain
MRTAAGSKANEARSRIVARPGEVSGRPLFPSLPVTVEPDRNLLTYYALSSLVLGPGFFLFLVPMYFRYHTMRYEIDEEGIRMRWGLLFRREVSLTFTRIQDIHLTSNFVERWLGLGRIQVQTASGSAAAEMTIEGVRAYEALRDFLYERMRGARNEIESGSGGALGPAHGGTSDGLAEALTAVAEEMRAIRRLVEQKGVQHRPEGGS